PGGTRARASFVRQTVGDEHVAEAPHRLDEARLLRVFAEELAQARYLHVDGAVVALVLAAAGEVHQLVARHGLARMRGEDLEQRELSRGEGDRGAVAGERAAGQVQREGAEVHDLR